VLQKLDSFRGNSRFTTWAYKFALLEAGVKARRRSWQDRELPVESDGWTRFMDHRESPDAAVESAELFDAIGQAISDDLTSHQRTVLVALALNDVPIDVLAERMDTTRGALYKTLHDARRRLREQLEAQGLAPDQHAKGDA
jgi:RNA polymerase sigma-70 factor (ECF subfamily)